MSAQPISADPDVVQAADDLIESGTIERIEKLNRDALRHPPGSPGRGGLQREAKHLMADIETRGERIGASGAALYELAVAEASSRARQGRGAPQKPTSRTLFDSWQVAMARTTEARRALTLAQRDLSHAQTAERAAEEACALNSRQALV